MSKNICMMEPKVNTHALLWAIREHPELWNQHNFRTSNPDSPHFGIDDIFVRYAAPELNYQHGPHDSMWYKSPILGPAHDIAMGLMAYVGGERLGGVLITQVPPGKSVKPHSDDGWHARYYNKFAVQIESAPGQAFCFDNERFESMPGDVYSFDNSKKHWVENPTIYNRITMIVCIKYERGM